MESSSSCHVTEIKYDVFISFRGTDIRKGLLSHLKKELGRRHVDTYVDERLEGGDKISPALFRAIETSQILLVVFSKDYASSTWCLEELAKMIECMEKNERVLVPVFFNVEPSQVRHQHGEYGVALAKHEEGLEENMLKVNNWRSALETASNLEGFHYPGTFKDESDFVDHIVEDILEKLSKFGPSESNGLVGIDHNIAQVQSLLLMEPSEVRFVGIWGMGGIGKTTIARAIFDKYSLQYEGCCILNVREELERQGLSHLRERLISELMEEEGLHTSGTSKARYINFAIRKLRRKNVFIVLDDVNSSEQLKKLVREGINFGPGSRVIITSRDQNVLTSGGVHQIYEVKKMDPIDSLKLFCLDAFNECLPKLGYEELSGEVVKIARGNPLALKVLGSYFHSMSSIETWRCALNKIKKIPHKKIQSVLRFSYDGLHDLEKKAFLDIAFFFIEEDKDYVIRLLDSWGFCGSSGIEVLQQKALITISNDNKIQMHDLIREMGLEIVRRESPGPEGRSRLRKKEEVYHVLRNKLGTDKVKAMQIDLSQVADLLPLNVDTFQKMASLRFLKFKYPLSFHGELSTELIHLKALLQDFMDSKERNLNKSNVMVKSACNSLRESNGVVGTDHNIAQIQSPLLMEPTQVRSDPIMAELSLGIKHSTRKDEPILSLDKQVESLLSGCEELKNFAREIHIKCVNYVVIDGWSGPEEFSVTWKETGQLSIKQPPPGMEILKSSIGNLSNIEGSDVRDQPSMRMPKDLHWLTCTNYLKVSKSIDGEQDTKKPKPHILFDGLKVNKGIIHLHQDHPDHDHPDQDHHAMPLPLISHGGGGGGGGGGRRRLMDGIQRRMNIEEIFYQEKSRSPNVSHKYQIGMTWRMKKMKGGYMYNILD